MNHGLLFTDVEKETFRLKNPYDTIVEGAGLNRVTKNFLKAKIDSAYSVTDQEVVDMAKFLINSEGLFVGSSTAMNLAVCVKLARESPKGSRIVTIACDSGLRHLGKFYNSEFLEKYDILPTVGDNCENLEFIE